ncbi:MULTISPECIES: DUF1648 domain-containing protein [unclassified Brevibacterium]|uniref:DUF1648 domain-containing protein n=1 Tax=unclassified Brevibacterium TaxID=2614124 RepID=UPI0010926868|nr:DUF1648 domain-containing protein [Brevibacterium sp. S22]TGD29855.1 DUF1648 domain-containing protein [Brevibacterium sp. S22]
MPSPEQPRRNRPSETAALVFAIVSILVFFGCCVWFWVQAPGNMATHFDSGGQPDGWTSKADLLWIFVPTGIGLPVLMSIRALYEKLPISLINAPFKEYWLERDEKAFLFGCLMELLRTVAGLTALLFASILVIIMGQARSATIPEWMTLVPTAVFLIAAGLAVWRLYRRLTPPR